mmetsp:Transcript_25577/g.60406  ORF Transcript_25577/g.60406 Transcript_25577/m.60406 type:complete len:283 (-) Transcript_25577:86-934(-)
MTRDSRRVCAIVDGGSEVWVGCAGGGVCRFDVQCFEQRGVLQGHTADVVAMSSHNTTVWTGSANGICVWHVNAGADPTLVKEVGAEGHEILCLMASTDGTRLYCGTHSSLIIFSTENWEYCRLKEINMEYSGGCTDIVEVNRDPSCEVWCIHGNSEIGIWDVQTNSGQSMHKGYGAVCKLLALPNNEVWSAANDGSVIVSNAKNKRTIRGVQPFEAPISAMVAVPNQALGVLTVWAASFEGEICIWVAEELHVLHPDVVAALLKKTPRTASAGQGYGGCRAM